MKIFYYISIIFFLFFVNNNFISAEYTINIDNSRKNLKSIKINNIDFVQFEQLIKLFNNSVKYDKKLNLIHSNNFSVTAQPNNFFVFFKINDTENDFEKIIQLSVPAIERKNILYLPIESFIFGLNFLVNFNFDIISNQIFIETNDSLLHFFEKLKIEKKIIAEIPKTGKIKEIEIKKNEAEKNKIEKVENLKIEIPDLRMDKKIKIENSFFEKIIDFNKFDFTDLPEFIELKRIENQKNNLDENKPKLDKIPELNDSLPPFRKYSIPDSLIKKKLEEL